MDVSITIARSTDQTAAISNVKSIKFLSVDECKIVHKYMFLVLPLAT